MLSKPRKDTADISHSGVHSAGAMRSKGLLEISSALCGSREIKVVGRVSVGLNYKASFSQEELNLNLLDFGTGGMSLFEKLEKREVDVGWINPAAPLTMAAKGNGPFDHPIPVATIATFPSWDRLVFAISRKIGIESLAEIKEKQYPLKVSVFAWGTKGQMYKDWATIFAIEEVLKFYGFSLKDIEKWGGSVQVVPAPRDSRRLEAIDKQTIDAVFDEGIQAWGSGALAKGMKFINLAEGAIERMRQFGFRRGLIRKSSILGLDQDVVSLDFSGWPMFVHPDMSETLAYQLCLAIEARRGSLPVDQEEPLDMGQLCRDSESCQLDVPLHPGAVRFYKERGYLR